MRVSGLTQVTSLDISRTRNFSPRLEDEELGNIANLSSLRHLSLAGHPQVTVQGEEHAFWLYSMELLNLLSSLTSCAILDISPASYDFPNSITRYDASWLASWEGLVSLQHLPLRELRIGITKPQPGNPAWAEDPTFYRTAQEALAEAPARMGLALLRGTREWPSSKEACVLLERS